MKWFYADQGQQIGPIEDTELSRLVREGKIKPETMVWSEGMPGWQPLSQARPSSQSIPPLPGGVQCASCGNFFPPSDLITIQGRQVCGACKPTFVQALQEGAVLPGGEEAERNGPAWEQRESLGMFKAIVETVKTVLIDPATTFSKMKREGGLTSPFLYTFIMTTVMGIVGVCYNLLFNDAMLKMFQSFTKQPLQHTTAIVQIPLGIVGVLGVAAIYPFIAAGITHLCLMMVGGANRSFEVTFRVMAYSYGSVAALQLVPVLGGMAAAIWNIVAVSIGLAKAHNTTTGKAVAAVLLPLIVCCGFFVVIVIIAAVAGTAAMRQH